MFRGWFVFGHTGFFPTTIPTLRTTDHQPTIVPLFGFL
jgi:hypothetical protein